MKITIEIEARMALEQMVALNNLSLIVGDPLISGILEELRDSIKYKLARLPKLEFDRLMKEVK
jgi:hypothetical protein